MKIQCNPHSKSKSFHIPATQNYVTLVPKNATSHPCLAQRDDGGAWVCPFVMGNMGKCWSTLISHQIWHAWDHLFHRKFMSGVKCLRTSDLWRVTWFTDDLLIQPKFTTCPTRHENKIVFFFWPRPWTCPQPSPALPINAPTRRRGHHTCRLGSGSEGTTWFSGTEKLMMINAYPIPINIRKTWLCTGSAQGFHLREFLDSKH